MEDRIRQTATDLIEMALRLLKATASMLPEPAVFVLRAALAFLQWLIEELDSSSGTDHVPTPAR